MSPPDSPKRTAAGTGTGTGNGTGSSNRTAAATSGAPDDQLSGTERFAWRRKIKANPLWNTIYRVGVAVVGAAIIVVGIVLLPLPGPGWVIIFLGIGLWATEFAWAKRLLTWAKAQVARWTHWLAQQAWWVKGLVGLVTFIFILVVLWCALWLSGVPTFLPAGLRHWMRTTLHLNR